MNHRLLLHKSVGQFLEKRPAKQRQELKGKLAMLRENPCGNEQLDIKPMQGYADLYRLRVGKYRFLYQVKQNELLVFVLKVGNRGEVYKK